MVLIYDITVPEMICIKKKINQKDIGIVLTCNRNPEIHKRIPTKNIFCSNFQDIVVKYPVFL